MRASDDSGWNVRAAEYVIGTLGARERNLFERILRRDERMRADVARWTRWFAPLDTLAPERRPGAHVWTNVAALVAADTSATGVSRVLEVPSLVDGSALFGVGVEPAGASTAAGSTGPVIAHGDALTVRRDD